MKSESIKELAAALSKAQGEIKNAKKDATNSFFRSAYCTLESVREVVNPVFAKYGLAVVQIPCGPGYSLLTLLTHESGEHLGAVMDTSPVRVYEKDKQGNIIGEGHVTPQALGSAITYARRYALMGVAGIAPEDDDGNAGTGHSDKPKLDSSISVSTWGGQREVYPAPSVVKVSDLPPTIKNWMDFVCHLGGLKGVKLGDMTEDDLQKVYKYITEKAKKTNEDNTLFAALSLAIGEKKREEKPDLPF